jgi:hypothetical protein
MSNVAIDLTKTVKEIITTMKTAIDNLNTDVSSNKTAIDNLREQILQAVYPVGSVYVSITDSRDPADILGFGTWEALPAGYTLIAQGSGTDDFGSFTYTAGQKYGERMHKLTVEEMPSHSHQQYVTANPGAGSYSTRKDYISDEINLDTYPQVQTGSTGGSQAHNLVQPSIAAYGWRRTA